MNLKNKVQIILEELDKLVRDHYKEDLISLIVFGSISRGTFREDSDIDLLIIANNLPNGRIKRINHFMPVEEKMESLLKSLELNQMYLSTIIKSPEEAIKGSPLFLDMIEDGIILYDKDNFFKDILNKLKENLQKLGAKRIRVGNIWYWKLKKDYKFGEEIKLL